MDDLRTLDDLEFENVVLKEKDEWMEFAYLLANALGDEIHYSQTPSEDSLKLLRKARLLFPDSELVERLDEMRIAEMEPVE